MHELDEIVFNEIRKLSIDPNYIGEIKSNKNKTDDVNKVDLIKKEIRKLEDQISRFMDLYGIGKFTIDQVSGKVDPLNEQKQNLEKELESITSDSGVLSEEDTIEIVKSFGDILDRGDLHEIRLAIESLIYYIEIDGDDVYIHWRFI